MFVGLLGALRYGELEVQETGTRKNRDGEKKRETKAYSRTWKKDKLAWETQCDQGYVTVIQ